VSFVEKHKLWLLPLLGAGVLAVVYFNYRSLHHPVADAAAAPPAADAPAPAPAAPAADAAAQASPALSPAPAAEAAAAAPAGEANGLWGDLEALAQPPPEVVDAGALRDRSRASLDPLLGPAFPAELPRPGTVRQAEPARAAALGAQPAPLVLPEAPPPPELAFILSGPDGLSAWFAGRPYREGQTLPGGYRVTAVRWNGATLAGPGGRTVTLSTFAHRFSGPPRPALEAP
jgi:hypothetical protein